MNLKEIIQNKMDDGRDLKDFNDDSKNTSKIFSFNCEKIANQLSKRIGKKIVKEQILRFLHLNKNKTKKQLKNEMFEYFK